MIYVVKLVSIELETKHIVSFRTAANIRVDISKRFLKKNGITGRWSTKKSFLDYVANKETEATIDIILGDWYLIETTDFAKAGEADLKPIISPKTILPLAALDNIIHGE